MRHHFLNAIALSGVLLCALTACGGGGGGAAASPAPALQSLVVTPASPTIAIAGTQQFTATAHFADGSSSNATSLVVWTSSQPSVATLSHGGLATGVHGGTSTISAMAASITGSTVLTVSPPTLQSISVTPATHSLAIGRSQQYTATGAYSDSTTADLTSTVTWDSSLTSVATVTTGGLATAAHAGASTISATSGSFSGNTTLTVAAPISGNPTVWKFDDPAHRLAPFTGTAELDYRDPLASRWGPVQTTFGKASVLHLPLINGEDAAVMGFPATTPYQGYTVTHHSAPNGVFVDDGYVSNYTLVMDVLLPQDNTTYRSLYQADETNTNDGEMFFRDVSGGKLGMGVNSVYNEYGSITPGTWHRVAIVVQCALGDGGTGQIYKYIDGLFVGGQYPDAEIPGDTRCRWALGPTFHLFTDNGNETAPGYVSSLLYVDRLMLPDEIKALGGPSASGASVPGAAAPAPPQVANRRVLIFAHRTNTARAPENTLAGITRAFDDGADHFECDIRRTSDGKLILMHDPDVDRTTDGTGAVDGLTLAQIKSFDAGSWFDLFFAGEQVPTLVEALTAANGRGRILLDIKLPGIGADIKAALNEAGVGDTAVWPSQQNNTDAVAQDFKDNLPGSGMLWGEVPTTLDDATFAHLQSLNVVGFDVHYTDVSQAFMDAAHAHGMFVVVWTALDPDTMLAMIALGADGMETDYPAVLDSLMPPPLAPAPAQTLK